jgi:threonine synthase
MITRHEAYPELAKALEVKNLFFKREDLHPYGSHKGRSIPAMIDEYMKQGIKHFALSSSGNAAFAAAKYVQEINNNGANNIILEILVGRHISTKKLAKLSQFQNNEITVTMHDRPLQTVFNKVQDGTVRGLRQSVDDLALIGYKELAEELLEIQNLQAIFIGTSSGTAAQALAQCFIENKRNVEVHIVQTSSCHPISNDFVDDETLDEQSIADAIVDHSAIRKGILIKLINETGGSGWIASNEQILSAQNMTKKYTGLDISANSALSVAGLMQAVYTGKSWDGSVACVICGD